MTTALRPVLVGGLALLALGPAAAPAQAAVPCRSDVPNEAREFFADFTGGPQSRAGIVATPFRGLLTSLSLRAVRDVDVSVRFGQVLGTITIGRGDGTTRHTLRMPREPARDGRYEVLELPSADGLPTRVTLRTSASRYRVVGCAVPLSVSVPAGARSVSLHLAPGVLGPRRACPAEPTLVLYASRRGAAPLVLRSGIRC